MKKFGAILVALSLSNCTLASDVHDLYDDYVAWREPQCGPGDDADDNSIDGIMCESHINADLTIDSAMPIDKIDTIIQASNDWNVLTDGRVNLRWTLTDTDPFIRIDPTIKNSDRILGKFKASENRIILRDRLDGDNLRIVVSHELGHSFGIGHHDDEGDQVMNKEIAVNFLGEKDLQWFNKLYAKRILDK